MQMYSLYCDFKCGKMQRPIVVIGLGWGLRQLMAVHAHAHTHTHMRRGK